MGLSTLPAIPDQFNQELRRWLGGDSRVTTWLPFSVGKFAAVYVAVMSVTVSLESLFEQVSEWGSGYLVSVSHDDRPHVVALRPRVVNDAVLRFDSIGSRTRQNVAERARVTLLFPPMATSDGFSLLVDGDALVDEESVDFRPTSAVLHRPAP